jgi:hypothetical protein
MIAIN